MSDYGVYEDMLLQKIEDYVDNEDYLLKGYFGIIYSEYNRTKELQEKFKAKNIPMRSDSYLCAKYITSGIDGLMGDTQDMGSITSVDDIVDIMEGMHFLFNNTDYSTWQELYYQGEWGSDSDSDGDGVRNAESEQEIDDEEDDSESEAEAEAESIFDLDDLDDLDYSSDSDDSSDWSDSEDNNNGFRFNYPQRRYDHPAYRNGKVAAMMAKDTAVKRWLKNNPNKINELPKRLMQYAY